MVDKIFYQQPIIPVDSTKRNNKPSTKPNAGTDSFQKIFEQQIGKESVKFSQHAQQRLNARNIQLTATELDKLNNAVQRAAEKGAKDSLVLMKDLAFVVSVKNNTVITAVDENNMKDHVFTNIDSAVIA